MTLFASESKRHLLMKILLACAISLSLVSAVTAKDREARERKAPNSLPASKSSQKAKARKQDIDLANSTSKRRGDAPESRRAEVAQLAPVSRSRANDDSLREDVQAMIAKDDLTGEDPEVRGVALNALGNRAGTVVVMDPSTGRIYSIVNQQWAMHEGFKPCSTIKLVTGLAGLSEGVIDSVDSTNTSSSNNVSLTRALAYSRNDYFQQVGSQVGFEAMLSYAHKLGLGEKTGINMRNEFAGRLPNLKARPGIARMSSHGDDFQVTAIQLAALASAIGNGGKLVTPSIVRSRHDELKFRTKVRRQIHIDSAAWQNIIPGMVGAVNYGSGNKAHDPRRTVAGKTGTCIEDGDWVGLFTSFAPLTNPRLAVVVITRGADALNHLPAAVAGRIYRGLDGRFGAPTNLTVASTPKTRTAGRKPNDLGGSEKRTASQFSDEDRTEMGNRTPLSRSKSATTNYQVKPVLIEIPGKLKVSDELAKPLADGQTRPRRVYGG